VPAVPRALRAAVYGGTVFISFFLMLVFMTYNAYLIAAVVVGASLGHYVFGSTLNADAILADSTGGKGMACH
jgi:copper transporter 1